MLIDGAKARMIKKKKILWEWKKARNELWLQRRSVCSPYLHSLPRRVYKLISSTISLTQQGPGYETRCHLATNVCCSCLKATHYLFLMLHVKWVPEMLELVYGLCFTMKQLRTRQDFITNRSDANWRLHGGNSWNVDWLPIDVIFAYPNVHSSN